MVSGHHNHPAHRPGAECRETQTHTWRADQLEKSRLNKKVEELQERVDTQQWLINKLRKDIKKLEAQLTPEAIAERFFRDGEAETDTQGPQGAQKAGNAICGTGGQGWRYWP